MSKAVGQIAGYEGSDYQFGSVGNYDIIFENGVIEAIFHTTKYGRQCRCEHPNCTGRYIHNETIKRAEDSLSSLISDGLSFQQALLRMNMG